jgi:secreted Zn-dependent insulinase-like peptidase
MAIVGDFDMAQAKELVTKYFGRIPKSDRVISREYPREKPTDRERRVTVNEAWPLPAVIVAYPITWDGNPDSYPLHLTSKILVGRRQLAHLSVAGLREGHCTLGLRRREHHRRAESLFCGGARRAGPYARRSRKGARCRV